MFGAEVPLWISLALGDLAVKVIVGVAMLAPYSALLPLLKPAEAMR
jgi:uncharacterized PurR-regulated membrane protein YhhQ (DUF165 family)